MALIEVVSSTSRALSSQPGARSDKNDGLKAKAADDASSAGSVDTQEAFLDMLGLSSGFDTMESTEEECAETDEAKPELPQLPQHECISLPARCSRYLHPPSTCLAFVLNNFFSRLECDQLIKRATAKSGGFQYITEAAHISPDGNSHLVKLQNPNPHKLSVFDHPSTISRMWSKLEPLILPLIQPYIERTQCGPPLGLNPRLRVLRYDSCDDDRFEPHYDATTTVGSEKKSLLTVLLYLNDGGGKDFEGGDTLYLDSHISLKHQIRTAMSKSNENITFVTPETGKLVIFEHSLYHASHELISGTKYVLRTDILFAVQDESTSTNHEPAKNIEEQPREASLLVSQLCHDLDFSNDIVEKLDGMGMLEMTLESFLAPGITILKMLLMEELSDRIIVDKIVHTACILSKR